MGEQKNIVIINGKTYDASTGALLDDEKKTSQKLVDDFVAPESKAHHTSTSHHHKRPEPRHLHHHKTQKSVTLKRIPPKKKTALARATSLPMTSTKVLTVESRSKLLSSSQRRERAIHVNKSSAISRFHWANETAVNHQPLDVQPAPQATPVYQSQAPNLAYTSISGEDLFSQALGRAESHKQTHNHEKHRKHYVAKKLGLSPRATNSIAVILVVVMLGSFIAYQNAPNISMRVAASQSGIANASLPAYRPSGFSLSRRVSSQPGEVTISFHSNSDNRAFKVTQQSSNWDSQTLADGFLSGKQSERLSQANGKTIYLYEGSNATWVDDGIWYRVEGNSSLSSDQLLKLANSF